MADKNELVQQTKLAFDFIQKLYFETSYLIKEIEGLLNEEGFVIGKPRGYQISTRYSMGLESNLVNLWLLRKFGVFFCEKEKTAEKRGATQTKIDDGLKILYLRITLNDKEVAKPAVNAWVLYDIQGKPDWVKKFEDLMGHFEYNEKNIFKDAQEIDYEDRNVRLQGRLIKNNLFDINDSEAILNKIINPWLELYNKC